MPEGSKASHEPNATFSVESPSVRNLIQAETINMHSASPLPVHSFAEGPLCIGRIPVLAAARQQRPADRALVEALEEGPTALVCQVLSGMGGVGKTQIAAAYARRRWDAGELDLLVWVNATSRESIASAYAQAGAAVCGADPSDANGAAEVFLARLDRPGGPRWLIVLDDVTDPNHLADLWPPETERGRTVVTTRSRNAALEGARRKRVDVDLFTPEEAQAFLIGRLGPDSGLLDGAPGLAEELGLLPLALAQAAAYILDQPGLTCADYGQMLADRTVKLTELSPEVFPDGYRRSVAAALSLSIETADRHKPEGLAGGILNLASVLDPAGIPAELFEAEDALEALADVVFADTEEDRPTLTERQLRRTLGRLHQLSLIDAVDDTVRVHALVQRTVRDGMSPGEVDTYVRAAADALAEVWPLHENYRTPSMVLRANAFRLYEHGRSALFDPEVHPVLFVAGRSLGKSGQIREAVEHLRRIYRDAGEKLGPDHPSTIITRNNLAIWRADAGDEVGAAADLEAVLADQLRVLGPDHPDTLLARHNLLSCQSEFKPASALLPALEELLADRLRVLGPDDHHTFTTRGDLARCRADIGDSSAAVTALEALLADQIRVLGPDHPDTLSTRSNLAFRQGDAGDAAGAVASFEELLADQLRLLGPDHPTTLITRQNLAHRRGETGDLTRAVAEFKTLLADRLRVLGPDHPHTLLTRRSLAASQADSGEAAGTAVSLERLLADQLRVLGPDHPDTFTTRGELARWQGMAGDPAGAAAAWEKLLADRIRVQGPEHPDTLITRNNVADWRGEAGDSAGAAAALEVLLADCLRALGPEHPHLQFIRDNLAAWREQAALDAD
jgi:hypothetical protein